MLGQIFSYLGRAVAPVVDQVVGHPLVSIGASVAVMGALAFTYYAVIRRTR